MRNLFWSLLPLSVFGQEVWESSFESAASAIKTVFGAIDGGGTEDTESATQRSWGGGGGGVCVLKLGAWVAVSNDRVFQMHIHM